MCLYLLPALPAGGFFIGHPEGSGEHPNNHCPE